jgi:hypothetical protein
MKIKVVVIDLEIPRPVKKWGLRFGVPIALLFGGGAVAWAAGLHTWQQGDTLNASDLNGNFTTLQGSITDLQTKTHGPSAFRAGLTQTTSVMDQTVKAVAFDKVIFDQNSEYTATNGTFIPKQAGLYLVECQITFDTATAANQYAAFILKNTVGAAGQTIPNSTNGVVLPVNATTVLQLAAGDAITCAAFHNAGSLQPVELAYPERNYFAATRIY